MFRFPSDLKINEVEREKKMRWKSFFHKKKKQKKKREKEKEHFSYVLERKIERMMIPFFGMSVIHVFMVGI